MRIPSAGRSSLGRVTLLRDIQHAAIGVDTPVAVLLRQCLVLGVRLGHQGLKDWANLELAGYPDDADLPPYRKKFSTQVLGDLSGPYQSGMRNAGLAKSAIPDEFAWLRESLFTAEVRMGVAEIEELVASGEKTFEIPWPTDVVALLQDHFYEGLNLMRAWQVVPVTALASTLSGIRDRVVQFALDLETENPAAGEAAPGEQPIPPQRVSQIFNQHFYGSHTTFAAAGRDLDQRVASVSLTIQGLESAMQGFGIGDADRRTLIEAVQCDAEETNERPGPRTTSWIDRLRSGAISVGEGVTTQTAVAVLKGLITGGS